MNLSVFILPKRCFIFYFLVHLANWGGGGWWPKLWHDDVALACIGKPSAIANCHHPPPPDHQEYRILHPRLLTPSNHFRQLQPWAGPPPWPPAGVAFPRLPQTKTVNCSSARERSCSDRNCPMWRDIHTC